MIDYTFNKVNSWYPDIEIQIVFIRDKFREGAKEVLYDRVFIQVGTIYAGFTYLKQHELVMLGNNDRIPDAYKMAELLRGDVMSGVLKHHPEASYHTTKTK